MCLYVIYKRSECLSGHSTVSRKLVFLAALRTEVLPWWPTWLQPWSIQRHPRLQIHTNPILQQNINEVSWEEQIPNWFWIKTVDAGGANPDRFTTLWITSSNCCRLHGSSEMPTEKPGCEASVGPGHLERVRRWAAYQIAAGIFATDGAAKNVRLAVAMGRLKGASRAPDLSDFGWINHVRGGAWKRVLVRRSIEKQDMELSGKTTHLEQLLMASIWPYCICNRQQKGLGSLQVRNSVEDGGKMLQHQFHSRKFGRWLRLSEIIVAAKNWNFKNSSPRKITSHAGTSFLKWRS